ncbi:MAG: family 16 glycosylhydrolase [archaeon]|nr:family 16 glycosylhydrolase [archaeon]
MKAIIDFYNEKVKVLLPNTLTALKNLISQKYFISKEDVDECVLSAKDSQIELKNENDFKKMIETNKGKQFVEIGVKISEHSRLYKEAELNLSNKVSKPKPKCPLGDDYELVEELSDEFEGNTLDSKKWWDYNPSWRCRKPSLFTRKNVKVSDGKLQLTASKMLPEEIDPEMQVRGYNKYWMSYVKSIKRIKYGYFETRCKSMKANICNAFWLYDPHSDQPDLKYTDKGAFSEEIDIIELYGKSDQRIVPDLQRKYAVTVHSYKTPYLEGIVNKAKNALPDYTFHTMVDFPFYEDFHTYALQWTPTEISWFLDGKKYFTRANDIFKRPLHVCFDCECQCDWAGLPDESDLPSTFEIDYVHVYQIKGVSEIIDFNYENLQPHPAQPTKETEVIHKGIVCDNCGKNPIKGIRYKCTVCEKFNLCEECENSIGIKHGHPFLKIRNADYDDTKEIKLLY